MNDLRPSKQPLLSEDQERELHAGMLFSGLGFVGLAIITAIILWLSLATIWSWATK